MQDYGHIRRMYLVDGLSQRQIAEKLGISRNTVAKYCEGNTYPGLRASYCRAASVMTPDIRECIIVCVKAKFVDTVRARSGHPIGGFIPTWQNAK